jgi:hypothetical protein
MLRETARTSDWTAKFSSVAMGIDCRCGLVRVWTEAGVSQGLVGFARFSTAA